MVVQVQVLSEWFSMVIAAYLSLLLCYVVTLQQL